MSNPVIISKEYKALFAFSVFSVETPAGTFFEKKNRAAAAMNNAPTPVYKTMTLLRLKEAIFSSVMAAVVPKKANATTIGPMAVPKELTQPPRFTRFMPYEGSPNEMAKGWAAVCCNENPSATTKRPNNIPANVFAFTAIIMAAAPKAENNKPYTMLLL